MNSESQSDQDTDPEMRRDEPGKIFVGNIRFQTESDVLRKYFAHFGEVKSVEIVKDPINHLSKGFGFVTFVDPASVDNVLSQELHWLEGRKILAKKVHVPKEKLPSPTPTPTTTEPFRTKKIFVGGVSRGTNVSDIIEYFEEGFGPVVTADLKINQKTGLNKGFAFVTFYDEDIVEKICDIRIHQINDQSVECKKAHPQQWSTPEEDMNKDQCTVTSYRRPSPSGQFEPNYQGRLNSMARGRGFGYGSSFPGYSGGYATDPNANAQGQGQTYDGYQHQHGGVRFRRPSSSIYPWRPGYSGNGIRNRGYFAGDPGQGQGPFFDRPPPPTVHGGRFRSASASTNNGNGNGNGQMTLQIPSWWKWSQNENQLMNQRQAQAQGLDRDMAMYSGRGRYPSQQQQQQAQPNDLTPTATATPSNDLLMTATATSNNNTYAYGHTPLYMQTMSMYSSYYTEPQQQQQQTMTSTSSVANANANQYQHQHQHQGYPLPMPIPMVMAIPPQNQNYNLPPGRMEIYVETTNNSDPQGRGQAQAQAAEPPQPEPQPQPYVNTTLATLSTQLEQARLTILRPWER